MKKISFIVLLLNIFVIIDAQIYVKTFTGYSLSLNPQMEQATEIISNIENVYVTKLRNGQGLNLGLAFGYCINDNFAVEIVGNTQLLTKQNISVPQKDYRLLNNGMFYSDSVSKSPC